MENTFSYDAASGAVHFWYAKGNSVMSGKEFHTYHEILFLLNAAGTLYTESEKYSACAGNAHSDSQRNLS